VDRADAVSHGVSEGEVLAELLGADVSTDRKADLIKAIAQLEEIVARAPLLLRILYHGLYGELRPDNHDVWARVGAATGCTKNQAWRKAHPPGMEVEPPK
jgi:hypothetical protein